MNICWCGWLVSIAAVSVATLAPATARTKQTGQNEIKGTSQMPGGMGQFGQTYTLVSSDGFGPVNFTLVSANYSVVRVSMKPGDNYIPLYNQKLLVIHYKLKNPNQSDMYYSSRSLFQAVDAKNNLIEDTGDSRQDSDSKEMIGATMKPGQGVDDLYTCVVVPSDSQITKLILKLAKPGSKEMVTRYLVGTKPNLIKPLVAPYADPADKSGASTLQTVSGVLGTSYPAGIFDLSLDSIALSPGPIGNLTADDGKQLLVATITGTNRTTFATGFDGSLSYTLKTDDGKITDFTTFKAKSDDRFDTQTLDPGESATVRCVIQVPKTAQLKTLSIAEPVNNSLSRAYLYDVSAVK